MMEGQNSGAESQTSDRVQPICDGSKVVGGQMDVVEAAADGGGNVELGNVGGVGEVAKKKRGRPPKAQAKPPPAKKNKEVAEEEDVCFICFDGGDLVLCDRRGCPKAYHPACIKRDEAFFESAARWTCGWHICSICQKAAHHMCYTCTYSLCRGCIRKADYVCVRGDKGFCTICMKTIMLIENNGQGEDGKVQADFDDKLSWEYLFKVYWVYLKGKLSLTVDELTQAKNPWKETSTTISSPLPSNCVHDRANDLMSITSAITPATSVGNPEENESKRRKIDEPIDVHHKETVNTEKPGNDESATTVGCKDWATTELLNFVAHMKNGNTSVLSRSDVQALLMEYITRNNLGDPRKKNQIVCDSRLKSLFGKPRVGHAEMLKLLEYHFFLEDDSRKSTVKIHAVQDDAVKSRAVPDDVVKSRAVQDDVDWNPSNMLSVGKDKKRRNRSKGEEREVPNKLDDFAAVDVHNVSLIYLRQDMMENLLEDSENFHGKVVGSIVRIRISGCDQKHDLYRLVQVVDTSKVDVPYKIDSKLTDVMLEVLNLDKKETISIDAISDQEFTEEECRRLQQSIRCGLVNPFIVGEIQQKAVALQSVRLNDWMEKEIARLSHLRDAASEKGHKKGYREFAEKIQLLKTPDERERRLQEIPKVHSDPKMNPDYESDDTEEYFNKEHGDHMESKFSAVSTKKSRSPKKRVASSKEAGSSRSRKKEKPKNPIIATHPNIIEESTKATAITHVEKDASGSPLGKSQCDVDCNGSTITKLDHQATLSSSVSNTAPEPIASSPSLKNTSSSPSDLSWHYRDPNGKVQGPFPMLQLQRWSTAGYFPTDMRVWSTQEDESVLLIDALKEQFHNNNDISWSENITISNNVSNETEGLNVHTAIPSVIAATPNPDSHGFSGQSFGQNWTANNNLNCNPTNVVSLTTSNESTVQLNTSNITKATEANESDIKHDATGSKNADPVFDLPDPTPKRTIEEDEKIQYMPDSKPLVQDSGNPPSWSSASSLVVGGPKLPTDQWGGCSSTPVKREEWDSGIVSVSSFKPLEVAGDHVATPTSNMEQNINSSQPACNNDIPTWHSGEMIEFSTLAEESVSDLLAEVAAMESEYGLPSPTSRRNSFVDDLFNGSFDEFSPTPDQGTRSDGFSSSGDIQLPCQSTTTTDEHLVGSSQGNNNININNTFDLMKTSNGLQLHSFISIDGQTVGIPPRTDSENLGFKWPEMERTPEGMIDINRSAKAEGDEGEMEVKVKVENGSYIQPVAGGGFVQPPPISGFSMHAPSSHMRAGGFSAREEEDSKFIRPPPPPPPPLTLGLDPFDPHGFGSKTMEGRLNNEGTMASGNIGWERYNSSRNSDEVENSGYNRSSRSSIGSGGGGSRTPSKGQQRVCRFYESGRCRKGASCKYLHP